MIFFISLSHSLTQLDGDPGDLIVILQQMDHDTLKRQGIDLFVDKKISLREALCGFDFELVHLDGRKLNIKCPPGEVLSPGVCVCVCMCMRACVCAH